MKRPAWPTPSAYWSRPSDSIADNPVFIEIGINPGDLTAFGVTLVRGHSSDVDGCARGHVGVANGGQSRACRSGTDSKAMAPGTPSQVSIRRETPSGTLGQCSPFRPSRATTALLALSPWPSSRLTQGTPVAAVTSRIDYAQPELTTISTASQFGRADRNLVYLQAAVNGSTVLAILIGAVIVGNTMLLSLIERTREFGLLRAIGWTRRRTVALLLGESLLLAVLGAALGVCLSFIVTAVLGELPALKGILNPNFTEGAFLASTLHRPGHDLDRSAIPDHPRCTPLTPEGAQL